MDAKRAALALAVLGVVLLPGVGYVYAIDGLGEPEPYRSSASYAAAPVDAENDSVMAERYRSDVTFYAPTLRYRHVEDEFAARNETRAVLLTAMRTGTASTDSDAVRADLQSIQRNDSFVTEEYDEVYRLSLARDGETTVVTATPANESAVAAAARDRVVVEYESLTHSERRTFEKIQNATRSGDDFGYRPWSNESVPHRSVVEKGGTYYAVETVAHVDDFHFPDGFVLGVVASGLGVLSLVGALVLGLIHAVRTWRREE